jgi:hypothetical protein
MKQNMQMSEAWETGVGLGRAWWTFADAQNKRRIRELQREGAHLGLQCSLQDNLVARISAGELQAIGIEGGSGTEPSLIPQRYFWRPEIDWEKETVESLGKKFFEVRVQGERGPADVAVTEPQLVDPRLIEREPESAVETLPNKPAASYTAPIQGAREPGAETPLSEPTPKKLEETPAPSRGRGRPSKTPEIEQAIDILLARGVNLAKMLRPKAYDSVRECAASELNLDITIGFSDPVIQRSLFGRFGPRR